MPSVGFCEKWNGKCGLLSGGPAERASQSLSQLRAVSTVAKVKLQHRSSPVFQTGDPWDGQILYGSFHLCNVTAHEVFARVSWLVYLWRWILKIQNSFPSFPLEGFWSISLTFGRDLWAHVYKEEETQRSFYVFFRYFTCPFCWGAILLSWLLLPMQNTCMLAVFLLCLLSAVLHLVRLKVWVWTIEIVVTNCQALPKIHKFWS